jgi:hypothetical protein
MRSEYVAEASVPADTMSDYSRAMNSSALEAAVTARFIAINGDHWMTPEDDLYVSKWFVPLPELAERVRVAVGELRRLILANRLLLLTHARETLRLVEPRIDLANRILTRGDTCRKHRLKQAVTIHRRAVAV